VIDESTRLRLNRLASLVERELKHLQGTDARLFSTPFTAERARKLEADDTLAERVDAFVARFGRLQDTLGDKLLPRYLDALGEETGANIDNLSRAERLGLIDRVDQWLELRRLRNRMIYDYVDDPVQLAEALQAGHEGVAALKHAAERILTDMARRGWRDRT